MKLIRFTFIVITALCLAAGPAIGQGLTTATLSGRVSQGTDGLPGVTITAKSPSLQGSRVAHSGANGDYVLANLAPGDYTITFELSGFAPVMKKKTLNAGTGADLDANMSVTATAETVVQGRADVISTTPQASATYTTSELEKLPTGRTMLAAVALSPGVNQNGPNNAFTIAGAMSFENLFTVNGVVVSDNVRTTPNALFIEDAIQETTTSVSGISAEFGRFTGGVVNTITKSGGNTFSGSLRTTFTNDAWSARSPDLVINNANFVPTASQSQVLIQNVVPRYEATLGGPILKDRVWFFGAGRLQNVKSAAFLSQPILTQYEFGDDEKRYEGKLTISPLANHTLTGSYIKINRDQTNYAFTLIPIMDLASAYDRQLPQDTLALSYNGVLTNNLFLEAQYSKRHFSFENSGGRTTDLYAGTVIRDRARGTAYNSPIFCGVCGPEKRDNDDYTIKGTYFLATPSVGSHNIVVGYDNFGGQRVSNNYQSGSNYHIFGSTTIIRDGVIYPQWVGSSNTILVWYPIPVLSQGSDVRTQSVFLNDQWRLSNKLSFNLGVRYDKNGAKDSFGSTTANDSAWSPRLSAVFDPTGDNKVRFTASYAKYVAAPAETQVGAGSPAGSPAVYQYIYRGPTINPDPNAATLVTVQQAMQQLFAYFGITAPNQAANINPDGASVPGVNVIISPGGLNSPAANEYTLGIAGQVGRRGSFRVDAIHRKYVDFYNGRIDQTTGIATNSLGQRFDIQLVENSNSAERKYYGLNTSFSYRFTDALSLGGNWTWSHLYGNFVGENSGSGPIRFAGQQYPEYISTSWNVPTGDLGTDQRHRVRLYGSFDLPLPRFLGTFNIGAIQAIDTGQPYGAVGIINPTPYVTNPGYVQPPTTGVNYYFTARDAFHTDTIYQTDLSLNYSKTIGPVEFFLQPQVLNVFNNRGVTGVDATVFTALSTGGGNNRFVAFNPFTSTPVQRPNGDTTNVTSNWDYGPNFGKPTAFTSSASQGSFQLPRTFRVSVGLRF